MKCIGQVDLDVEHILHTVNTLPGELRPGKESATASQAQLATYTEKRTYPGAQWRFYYAGDFGYDAQPWQIPGVDAYRWWIVVLEPGCVFPTHVDTFENSSERRLWAPVTAPQPGHVFQECDRVYTDCESGTLWEFDTAENSHGAANFGHSQRVTLQIVVHK
jgi:hypothetical protein